MDGKRPHHVKWNLRTQPSETINWYRLIAIESSESASMVKCGWMKAVRRRMSRPGIVADHLLGAGPFERCRRAGGIPFPRSILTIDLDYRFGTIAIRKRRLWRINVISYQCTISFSCHAAIIFRYSLIQSNSMASVGFIIESILSLNVTLTRDLISRQEGSFMIHDFIENWFQSIISNWSLTCGLNPINPIKDLRAYRSGSSAIVSGFFKIFADIFFFYHFRRILMGFSRFSGSKVSDLSTLFCLMELRFAMDRRQVTWVLWNIRNFFFPEGHRTRNDSCFA